MITFLLAVACLPALQPPKPTPPDTTPAPVVSAMPPALPPEVLRASGWRSLSGADATSQWRSYKGQGFPKQGWSVADGALVHTAGGGGGDIITVDQYKDFEFVCEFKTGPKANSGIIYRVMEGPDATWMTGPEFQVLDDAGYGEKPTSAHSAAALYDIFVPVGGKVLKPAGEWNHARILVSRGVVEHWLNGVELVHYRLFEEDGTPLKFWTDRIAASKFKEYKGFGVQPKGHIALQDHGDEVAYRNVMVRDLDAPMPGEIKLFNGKDLTGWEAVVPDLAGKSPGPASVWSVDGEGNLVCKGSPAGYIRTTEKHTNYVLRLQWRFSPVTKKVGNSGVLLRLNGADKVWPRSVEAQLMSGSAGDFWNIDEMKMTVDVERTRGRNTKHYRRAEWQPGEWNDYEIIVNHGDIVLKVNGDEVNRATGVEETPGYIALQSEGSEIHFRNIRLIRLP